MRHERRAPSRSLLRRLHEALSGFDPNAREGWARDLADPSGGPLRCHNDICPENVIFRGGRAVAIVDFDFAAPGRPLWDVVQTVRMWAPTDDPTARVSFPPALDAVGRIGVLTRAYGVEPGAAEELVELIGQGHEVGRQFVHRRLATGEPAFVEAWERFNGAGRERRNPQWLAANHDAIVAAVAGA